MVTYVAFNSVNCMNKYTWVYKTAEMMYETFAFYFLVLNTTYLNELGRLLWCHMVSEQSDYINVFYCFKGLNKMLYCW